MVSGILDNTLIVFHKIFMLDRNAACLKLGHKQCFLVPVAHALPLHIITIIKDFLTSRIPDWADFNIPVTAEYLGIWLGPKSSGKQFIPQTDGFLSAVRTIAAAQVAPSIAVKAYNSRAVPKMSYIAQFLPPPPSIDRLEKYAFTQIFKIPYNSVSNTEQFSIAALGIQTFTSIHALFTAAKVRYQHRHWPILHDLHTSLLDTLEDINLSDAARGTRSHWQSTPLILNIIEGASGRQFSDDENTSSLIADALADAVANGSKIQKSFYTALH